MGEDSGPGPRHRTREERRAATRERLPVPALAPGDPLRRAGTHGRAGRARDRRRSSQRATRAAASRFR